jgi:HTH-type transcriptional regulator/antitoxin HigA
MDIRPLATEADYDWALAEIARYFDVEPAPGTLDAARFDVLAALIGHYEATHWPIEAPDAVDAIRACMEARGWGQSDLAAILGSRSRASELLRRKRGLTMEQAFRLHAAWGVPADALIRPSRLVAHSA